MGSRQPLSRWIALRFALVAALPLLVVCALVWLMIVPEMNRDIGVRYQALARAIAGQVEAHLLGAQRELGAIGNYIGTQEVSPPPRFFSLLDVHVGSGDVFEAIYVADIRDSILTVGLSPMRRGNRDVLLGLDLSQRSFLKEVRGNGGEVWSETFLSTVSGTLAVALAIPLGENVLIGEIAIDRLSEFISHLPAGQGVLTTIIDRRGRIIADSQRALGGQMLRRNTLELVADTNAHAAAMQEFELEGTPYIGAVVDVSRVGWKVLVAQSHSDAFRHLTDTLWLLGAGLVIALLLSFGAGWGLSRDISHRFGRYIEQARAIAHGNYDEPWPESKTQEFADLAENLQRMCLSIRERERALAASEARYRSVVSNTPVAIFEFDHEGKFTLSEGRGLGALGLKPGQLVGASVFDFFRQEPDATEFARRALAGESLQFTARVGPSIFEIYYNPVIDRDEAKTSVIGVAVDISERTRREEELRQRTDELTRFTYTVSHDLKTPLVTIRSFVGFLEQDMKRQDDERVAKDLAYIRNAAEKMSRLLDELLELARVGRKVNPPEEMTLQELVQEALDLLAGRLVGREVAVKVTPEPILLHGDRPRLREVFQNLLDNAVKFMGDQTSPEIEVGVEEADHQVVFFIRDNGMGIDPRFRDKVFDLFEKLESQGQGSGIGLALVKRIIEVHGGRIWVDSNGPGQGTTFRFTLREARRVSPGVSQR